MHTYRRIPEGNGDYIYVVGFFFSSETEPDWTPLADCKTEREARALTSFLNGGEHPRKPWSMEE